MMEQKQNNKAEKNVKDKQKIKNNCNFLKKR